MGSEINGKSETFARPVLIVRKLTKYSFIGVPLTTKRHEGNWYAYFGFKNAEQIAVVAQVKNISSFRLYKKMGAIPESDLELVRKSLCSLILGKNIP
ncbi:type II toxin-antitoxin system PemK/MazF family toxin [Candidatus Saccharibacteria bacterium]|nr:type II toxin-antitoxin system PemK/MazF family toxin [Candidatus Saccharibacteria bacterium]